MKARFVVPNWSQFSQFVLAEVLIITKMPSVKQQKAFQNTHGLEPLDVGSFVQGCLAQLTCEKIKNSASEQCVSWALLCSLEVALATGSSPSQVTKVVKSPRLLKVLQGVSQNLLIWHYKPSVSWNPSQHTGWLRLTDVELIWKANLRDLEPGH